MPVHCQLRVEKPSFKRTTISYRKVKSIDIDALKEDLLKSDLCNDLLSLDLDVLVARYNDTLLCTLNKHAPLLTKSITKRPTVPWFTMEVKAAKKERRKAERKWRRSRDPLDLLVFNVKKNHATHLMKSARKDYYTKVHPVKQQQPAQAIQICQNSFRLKI